MNSFVGPLKDSDLINSTSVELKNISNQIKWAKIEKKCEERIQDFLLEDFNQKYTDCL